MHEDDAERIGAVIQRLRESERLAGCTGDHGQKPLRLYRTRGGEFVRVLDDDAAPLTARMLRAIEAYSKEQVSGSAIPPQMHTALAATDGNQVALSCINSINSIPQHKVETPTRGPTTFDQRDDTVMQEDVVMEEPTETIQSATPEIPVEKATPSELDGQGISVGAWLNGDDVEPRTGVIAMEVGSIPEDSPAFNHSGSIAPIQELLSQWPHKLLERTRVCHAVRHGSESTTQPRCILYWIRNTFRVANGNFALAAAQQLGQQLSLPVVAVSLLPSSIQYPVRHASGINEALTRWSICEMRRRLRDESRIELFAFTPQESWPNSSANSNSSAVDGGSALHTLFDAFSPATVVTDDGFSVSSRTEVECLRQFLQTRVRASWSLLAVDSMTCVAVQSRSEAVRKSFDVDTAMFLTQDQFAGEYAALIQQNEPLAMAGAEPIASFQYSAVRQAIATKLDPVTKKVQVQEVLWEVVEAMNVQSSASVAVSSERVALERLESLVVATDDRPAIQQELQGSGIMSLLPFIRHGTLFSGFVLDRLASAIASMPRPTDATSRKAFAMLKVLRSRASIHLARERDYALYLSLWASRQVERELQLSGRAIPFRALASFQTAMSELDTYTHVLPSWVSPNKHLLGGSLRQSPIYDPYQLESGRTDDPYWNEIQLFLIETRYLHPLVLSYWAYRVLQWSVSSRAGIATIEALLDKCSLGSTLSPDATFSLWISLFRLGNGTAKSSTDEIETEFVQRVETELSNQQRLQIRK